MITFEDLQKANETIVRTDIKGKEYAEVNQRIKAFRMVFPEGFITTDLLELADGVCTFRAHVGYYAEDKTEIILGTGTAQEKETSSFINRTSYIENCETSAVGRALGMAGFGIDTSVASAEEVANAINNQNQPEVKEEKKWICSECGCEIEPMIDAKGRSWTPQALFDRSIKMSKDGNPRCVKCFKKYEKRLKETASENTDNIGAIE